MNGSCELCGDGCQKCKLDSKNEKVICESCQTGYYKLDIICRKCPTACKSCSSESNCISCKSNFGLKEKTCVSCGDIGCETCKVSPESGNLECIS